MTAHLAALPSMESQSRPPEGKKLTGEKGGGNSTHSTGTWPMCRLT